ncbi:MAG: carbamoyltransferase HypF [Deltaproteobacteria bacterium]|nr:carbamoyltransferase HypF [Deltaproteobacteria bacterium]
MNQRFKGAIEGIVQGVGFRPFIYRLAARHALSGYVTNTASGVDLEIQGEETDVHRFIEALPTELPPLAHIASAAWRPLPVKKEGFFQIRMSETGEERSALISPDVCVCADCLREMRDPANRRFGYPFINCTNCGPRYTIIKDIPYDRAATTMDVFTMCPACRAEYDNPADRRFHAQPNACWECGPRVSLHDPEGALIQCANPIKKSISLLSRGAILAIKGLGGFHLAVNAEDHEAVVRLRKRKHREEKPLAIMVKHLDNVFKLAHVDPVERKLLRSGQRPIVILKKRRSHGLSPQVAPKNTHIGIMLPYTPLHYLLMEGLFRALVMTSGNMTEEPINTTNPNAFKNLHKIADYFLIHNRNIYLRSDDSVVRVIDGVPRQIRRSRGYVPRPLFLSPELNTLPPVLSVGGELKDTVCLTKANRAFLSQHIGDMENLETLEFFNLTVRHLKRILEIQPEVIAHDLHPDYLSSKFARHQSEAPTLAIQHHHAHGVGCMAEHGLKDPVIGVVLDGTGLGTDGQIWGGEILLCDLTSFERRAHLTYVPLPGGDAAARFPWRMAMAYLYEVFGDDCFNLPIPFVQKLDQQEAALILRMARKGVNSPLTSSFGRLFDAVSALIGLRNKIAYEGQAAIELEMCQTQKEEGEYAWKIDQQGDRWVMSVDETIRMVVDDLRKGTRRGMISRRFHRSVIKMLTAACQKVKEESGLNRICLSGGCFQNATLLSGLTTALEGSGFEVYSHVQVPTNDGALCLGQAVCAGLTHAGMKGAFAESYEIHG